MRPVAQIAQSVEQGIENPRVGGSIPSLGTTFRFQVMPSTSENTQEARLVRAFCFQWFPTAPLLARIDLNGFLSSAPGMREDAQVLAGVSDKRTCVVAQIARLEIWEQIAGLSIMFVFLVPMSLAVRSAVAAVICQVATHCASGSAA